MPNELPIILFKTKQDWERWLEANHAQSNGLWLKIAKKASGLSSVTYAEALDVALCYGWIDGQKNTHDEQYFIQKFTPRRAKSIWSKRNIEHTERLIKTGKMKPAGLKQIDAAKKDGRWQRAYDSPTKMEMPEDFLKLLAKNKKAKTFFETLNRTNLYSIAWRLQTAVKEETREKRMKEIVEMLGRGEKFH